VHVFSSTHKIHGSTPRQFQHIKSSRTPEEVASIRQARKADIEVRCSLLSPPLSPNVLQHIEAYRAAMLIAAPMTELAWTMLKPRLLAQRESAELLEYTREQNMAALRLNSQPIPTEAFSKRWTKEQNWEYECGLQPLRTRLGEIADEYIYGQWHGGKALTWENTPIFAADALHHIWRSHMHEQQSSDRRIRAESRSEDHPNGCFDKNNILTLDNMKWVYDTKVRPLADTHRREHFICACCPIIGEAKWYGFESLMQHFGAKHTSSFSKGNIVVHWQTAEWPEKPPFHLSPVRGVKASHVEAKLKLRTAPPCVRSNPLALDSIVVEPVDHVNATHASHLHISHDQSERKVTLKSSPQDTRSEPQQVVAESSLPRPDVTAKKLKLVHDLSNMWSELNGIQTDLQCVLVRTVFHHAAKSFSDQYGHELPLDFVIEAISSQAALRPLRSLKGLACKVCVASANPGTDVAMPYYGRIRNAKLFKLPLLLEHFAQMHMSHPAFHWVTDMVETPLDVGIKELREAVGMDETKLTLIAAIVEGTCDPNALLATSTNKLIVNEPPVLAEASGILHRLEHRMGPRVKRKKSKLSKTTQTTRLIGDKDREHPTSLDSTGDHSAKPPLDPSRFDTDIGRSKESKMAPTTQTTVMDSVTAARPKQALSFPPAAIEMSGWCSPLARNALSPSGEAKSHTDLIPVPKVPLNIAAILASLNGQTHDSMSEMPPHQSVPLDRYSSAGDHDLYESNANPMRYTPVANTGQTVFHHASQSDSTGSSFSDGVKALRASLSTCRASVTVQHGHTIRSEARNEPRSQQAGTASRRWCELERHHDQHVATIQEQAVQFIQLPAQQHAQNDNNRHLSPQQITYVDEHGQSIELIPIERAPLPQGQYIPKEYGHLAYTQPVRDQLHASYSNPGQNWAQHPTEYDAARFFHTKYCYARRTHRSAEGASESRS
jgi:hypothetical protein